ncbi:MAG: hypothetical protein H0V96_05685 [Acidimicrobiia bacterium]|nr:hypothetical protein [Acidimicrobiia bacterium]
MVEHVDGPRQLGNLGGEIVWRHAGQLDPGDRLDHRTHERSPTPPVHGLHGRLLFDDDPPAQVAWQAATRFIYLDELPGIPARQAEWLKVVSRKAQDD